MLWPFRNAVDADSPARADSGFAVFGKDSLVRRVLDPEHKMNYWSEFDQGRHFPAMEVPDLLVGDVRTFFRSFR